jgi:hypothetical protein
MMSVWNKLGHSQYEKQEDDKKILAKSEENAYI